MATKKYFVLVLDMELKTHAYPEGLGEITQVYSDGDKQSPYLQSQDFLGSGILR